MKRKSIYTPGDFAIKVKRSATGKGIFAEEFIPKNKCLIEYIGVPVEGEKQYEISSRYLFETAKGKMINGNIPANTARFINHSCAGNCEARGPKGRVFIFSIKNIKPGEELLYDYGKEYFDEYLSNGRCMCKKCVAKRS